MQSQRKRYSAEFKARGAVEAIKGHMTINELASQFGVHPHWVTQWKKHALECLPQMFSNRPLKTDQERTLLEAELYQQIGPLKVELDWLKKKLDCSLASKRALIEPEHSIISVSRQCELVGLARSSYYYAPAGDSPENLLLLRLIDEQYTRTPFSGIPRMTAWLRSCGYQVHHKRVARLMRLMGIEALYPQPRLCQGAGGHRIYPSLLHGVIIAGPKHGWSTDITYIRLLKGFVYLVAIMDWYSRYVVSWELSNTLAVSFCLTALERALAGAQPEIFNSDQGVQFTSHAFTSRLEGAGIRISMDGRGRVFDKIFIERLWRTVKYEEVYVNDDESVPAVLQGLNNYFVFYNHERLHQALDYQIPAAVYDQRA